MTQEDYRKSAKDLLQQRGLYSLIRVPAHGNVHIGTDGAYVELSMWVPKEEELG